MAKKLDSNLSFSANYAYNFTMRSFFQNMSGSVRLSLLGFVLVTVLFPLALSAQVPTNPQEKAAEDSEKYSRKKAEELFGEMDIEELAFPKDKRGCAKRSSLFFAAKQKYKEGESVEEVAKIKMIEPLVQKIYDTIRKKGVEQATLDNMKEYQSCVENAEPNKNEWLEYDMALKQGACKELNAVILDTLDSIKKRKKADTVMRKYERAGLDLTGTSYEGVNDPAVLFIGTLYKASQTEDYQDVVELGSHISVGCHM